MGIDPSGRFSVIQATVATTVASILVNTAITGYSIGRTIYAAASGGSLVPDGVLISFRGVSYGAQARVVGLGFAGGFDAVYSSTRNRLVIFLASDFSVSPFATFKTEKGLKLKGSWSIGPIWNLGEPKNFRGFGASANWPLGSLHLLCRMGVIRSGSVWGYACQSRKLSLNKRGYTVAFGFSGFSDSTTSFIKISDGTEVSSDLLGWAIPVDASPLVEFLKPIVESIASSPTLDTVLEKIGSLSSGG